MTIAAADVKPADTGPDMKSIKNPKKTQQYNTGYQKYSAKTHQCKKIKDQTRCMLRSFLYYIRQN